MKTFKILCSTILIFCLYQQNVKAQISVTDNFYCGPVVSTTNNLYARLANTIENVILYNSGVNSYISPVLPIFINKYRLQSIETKNGNAKLKWWDWSLKNYSIGYNFFYMPKFKHIGFNASLNYERDVITCMLPGETQYKDYRKDMIVPKIALVFRIGNDFSLFQMYLRLGCRYDYTFDFKGGYNNKGSVNNGFVGIVSLSSYGISGIKPEDSLWTIFNGLSINYEHKFYNYFNTEFSLDGISYPYKDYKSRFGYLYFAMTFTL